MLQPKIDNVLQKTQKEILRLIDLCDLYQVVAHKNCWSELDFALFGKNYQFPFRN